MNKPNMNMSVKEMVDWYFKNDPVWSKHDLNGKPFTYDTLLDNLDGVMSKKEFNDKFMIVLKFSMQHGETLAEAIDNTIMSFAMSLIVHCVLAIIPIHTELHENKSRLN